MPQGLIALDLETSELIADMSRWQDYRPLDISCAATVDTNGREEVWHGPEQEDGTLAQAMDSKQVGKLVHRLWSAASEGYLVITWNGLAFDFCALADNAPNAKARRACEVLALRQHIDIAFAMLCSRGYMIGLEAAARGLRVPGKIEGMSGKLAVEAWAQGREGQERVLAYVRQDAQATLDIYQAIMHLGYLPWTSRSGRRQSWSPERTQNRLYTVQEATELPEPDTSWMGQPRTRQDCYTWSEWITTQLHGVVEEAPEGLAKAPPILGTTTSATTNTPPAIVQLHLDTDPAARSAISLYAEMIMLEHPIEAQKLIKAVTFYEERRDRME